MRNWLEVSQNKNHSHIHLTKSHSSPLCHAKSYCVGSVNPSCTPRNMCGYFPRSFEDEGFFFFIFSYIFSQSNFKDTTKNLTNFTKPSWSLIYVAVPILPFPVFCPSRFFLFQTPTLNSHNWQKNAFSLVRKRRISLPNQTNTRVALLFVKHCGVPTTNQIYGQVYENKQKWSMFLREPW